MAVPVSTAPLSRTRNLTCRCIMNHGVTSQSPIAAAHTTTANSAVSGPLPSTARARAQEREVRDEADQPSGADRVGPTRPPGGRRQARVYTRPSAVVNELM